MEHHHPGHHLLVSWIVSDTLPFTLYVQRLNVCHTTMVGLFSLEATQNG